jgi:L-alanine-DL-glutamate epimerase-like enolase superfamily enzyme
MQVSEVTVTKIHTRRQRAIRNGLYTYSESGSALVRVRTKDGIEGIGWANGHSGAHHVIYEAARALAPHAVGLDVTDTERLWELMFQPKLFGRRGLTLRAMSAIDNAMWDAAGKCLGLPLYKMLGGFRQRVPAYIAGGYYMEDKTLDDLAEEMRTKVAIGARYVKMKIGGAPMREDAERVRVVREAVGPDIGVMVDANNAYSPLEAIKIARMLEPYDPYWFEEPVHAEDYEGLAKVKAGTSIPIAVGENEYSRYGFRDLVACGGADILQADATVMGGVTEWRHVASFASAHRIPMAPHGSALLHVHLVGGVSNGLIVESGMPEVKNRAKGMFLESMTLDEDGMITAPDRPGIGVTLNEEWVKEHTVE